MDSKTKKQTLVTFYYIFILFGLSTIAVDPLIPVFAEKMQVGFDKIGVALFFGSISAFITNLVSGALSDRVDIKKLIISGLAFLCAGFLMFGIFINYSVFIFVIILLRAGFGTIDATIHSFSSKLFKENISTVFLKLDSAWYTGAFISPLLVSGMLYFEIPPKYLFFIFSFTYFVFALIFYRICPGKKIKEDGLFGINKKSSTAARWELSVFKDPVVINGSLALFFYTGSIIGLSSWMTTYFLGFGIKVAYGSVILSVYWFFSIIGMIIVTKLVARFREIIILFTGCFSGTLCLLIFGLVPNIYIKIAILALQALFFAGYFPLLTSISAHRNTEKSGMILGLGIALAFAGSILFQPLYGYVAEYLGKNYIFYLAFGGCAIGMIPITLLLKILYKNQLKTIRKTENDQFVK